MRSRFDGAGAVLVLLAIVVYIIVITAGITQNMVTKSLVTPTPTPPATSVINTSYTYFLDNAEAGFMQIVTIPHQSGMNNLDDFGYLSVIRDNGAALLDGTHRTYTVSNYWTDDARTHVGCFEAWPFMDGDKTSENYGNAFCIADSDMLWLFDNGAYSLSYGGY